MTLDTFFLSCLALLQFLVVYLHTHSGVFGNMTLSIPTGMDSSVRRKSMYFQFQVAGWLNTQYVKANSQEEAYAEAVHVAAGESNLYGFGEIKGEELEQAIAEDFNGCLHIPF